jgi:tetratricopeptide (TPR) repeat protein
MGWLSRLFEKKPGAEPRAEPAFEPAPVHDGATVHDVAPAPDSAPAAGGHPAIDQRAARDLREDSPEFDEFIARAELEDGGDLPHGARHLANLLLVDPRLPRWRELLDRYVQAAGPALDALVPDVDPRHASTEALRTWIWQAQGRTDEAVSRLVDVARALDGAALLHACALDWLEPEGAVESLDEEVGIKLFAALLALCGEAPQASASQLASLRRWSALLERAAPAWTPTSLLLLMRAGLMRKAGRFDAALALAGPLEDAVDFDHVVAIGLALRADGQLVESAQAFEQAARAEADGVTAWLEAGDSWLEAGRWLEASAAYEFALAREPGQPWAEPSAWYCRWKLDGDDAWRARLDAATASGNHRAHALLFREFGAIAESADASADTLRQMRARWLATPPGAPLDAVKAPALSTPEAPSARLAMALEHAAFGLVPAFERDDGHVPADDPRRAVADVAFPLWTHDGTRAAPALPAAGPATTALIADLASQRYHPHDNWAQASHVAALLGPDAAAQVLAVMVNPPPVPAGTHALAWLPRVQLAAAMVVGQIDAGWEGSQRRAALHSLLFGPADWTTTAGIRVLGWIARSEPAHAQDIHRMFEERERHLPSEGHWDWVAQLYREWQTLPWLSDDEREVLKGRLAAPD